MISISIHRAKYDYLQGKNKEERIWHGERDTSSELLPTFNLLFEADFLEGGDIVTFYRDTEFVRSFVICNNCKKHGCVNDTDFCKNCALFMNDRKDDDCEEEYYSFPRPRHSKLLRDVRNSRSPIIHSENRIRIHSNNSTLRQRGARIDY